MKSFVARLLGTNEPVTPIFLKKCKDTFVAGENINRLLNPERSQLSYSNESDSNGQAS